METTKPAIILPANSAEHIELILSFDNEWASDIVEFIRDHPEFRPYIPLASITPKPFGHGKERGTMAAIDPPQEDSILEYLLYYITHTAAYTNYANSLWHHVKGKTKEEIQADQYISDVKKSILLKVLEHQPYNSWEDVYALDIKGLGQGAKRFIRATFSDYIDATDPALQVGLQQIYTLGVPPTTEETKEIVKKWSCYPRVGAMFAYQVYHHLLC